MPTVSSSPIAALSHQLASLGEIAPQARGGLLEVLESVPDPRKKRVVRHRFSAILFVSVCAVVSGARSFAAIAEWAADAVSDAVDDTLRGMGIGHQRARMVMACLDHDSGVTLGQVEIAEKSNEIPMFTTLLDTIADVTDLVVTADALHAQREHAEYPHGRGAHYVLTVKRNQKALRDPMPRS